MKNFLMKYLLLPGLLVFAACGDEEVDTKSMEQLQAENGIPVEIEEVKYQPFEKSISFFGKLSGIKQSINGALIGGRVEKINVKVGDHVKKGDIVMEWPTDAPGGMYQQAKAAFEMSEKNFNRMQKLLEAGEISQATFDGVKTQYEVDKRNYELQGQLHKMEAPFDGMITNISVEEGDNVKAKDPVFTIAQLHIMRTKVWANEEESAQIKKGMTARTSFRDNSYYGKVIDVAITPDPAKQAFYVEIEFENRNNSLITGITMDVDVIVKSEDKSLLVPRNLVRTDSEGKYVFVSKNGLAEKRYITNGFESGIYYQVNSGLAEGDFLIVKGAANLENGSKINVIQ